MSIPASTAHYHGPDSDCLTPMPSLWFGKLDNGQPVMEPVSGWWRCDRLTSKRPTEDEPHGDLAGAMVGGTAYYERPNGYLLHQHVNQFIAHGPRERCGFTA